MSEYLPGIDISGHQSNAGPIDWDVLKAGGLAFCIPKASEGDYYTWKGFADARAECRARGIRCGAYHFAHMGKSPEANAQRFAESIGFLPNGQLDLQPGDLLPALDVEGETVSSRTLGERNEWLLAFADAWKQYSPYPLMYYGSTIHITTEAAVRAYPFLWMARWTDTEPAPPYGMYQSWTVWQWRGDSGRIKGVTGPCDLDTTTPDRLNMITVKSKSVLPYLLVGGLAAAGVAYYIRKRRPQ